MIVESQNCSRFLAVLLAALAIASPLKADELQAAKPIDPVAGILAAFKDHSIVALGEGGHGSVTSHNFRLQLIADPRFADVVDDIVVESGNALYQETMDRFTRGKPVQQSELRKVWQDTTQASGVWDVPIYEEFFRAVRAVNASRPNAKQLRVLLGDPPIDWDRVETSEDVRRYLNQRDEFPAAVIRNEVLNKHRRALVVYGDMHFLRRNLYFALPDEQDALATSQMPVNTMVARLERDGKTKVFSIASALNVEDWRAVQSDIPSWPVPSLTIVTNTTLGAQPFAALRPQVRMFRMVNGVRRGFELDPIKSHRIQDQFDAILILSTRSERNISRRTQALCSDAGYMEMRMKRLQIIAPPGVSDPGNWLKQECAAQSRSN